MTITKKHSFVLLAVGCWLLAVCCLSCSSDNPIEGTDEERAYDVMQRNGQWEQIVSKSQKEMVQSAACQKVVRLAQYRLGRVGAVALHECLADSRQVLTSPLAALMMSDVYMQLGMVNMAQRAAFEAMVKMGPEADNGRALRRLTETAVITRQYDLALKYIALLEENATHREWAHSMRQILDHPTPEFEKLQKSYEETEDQFFL
jgi:hypothetical protein